MQFRLPHKNACNHASSMVQGLICAVVSNLSAFIRVGGLLLWLLNLFFSTANIRKCLGEITYWSKLYDSSRPKAQRSLSWTPFFWRLQNFMPKIDIIANCLPVLSPWLSPFLSAFALLL
jgi:hypothetical protein